MSRSLLGFRPRIKSGKEVTEDKEQKKRKQREVAERIRLKDQKG